MKQFSITPYHPKLNSEEIIALINHIQHTEFGITLTENDQLPLKNIDTYFHSNFWVALSNNRVIGCIGLKKLNQHEAEVKRFFVHQDHRGKGVSDGLIDIAIEQATTDNQHAIYLGTGSPKERAIAFYQKKNFIEIPKIELPKEYEIDPLDDRFFKLDLATAK